jgi:hypothetical protein
MGQRVEIPESTSQWQAGDRFGEVLTTETRVQYIRGRVDAASGRTEDDEVVWVTQLARVRLEGSGAVVEVDYCDCFVFDAAGNRYPAARKFRPRTSPARSDGWARQQWEEEITEKMVMCSDEILAEFGRHRDEKGDWSEDDWDFLEKVCRDRTPFER